MKKGFVFLLTVLLCAALLTGCGKDNQPPQTQPSEPQATEHQVPEQETQVPTLPVEEDVFYFSNEMEYDRLYSQRQDGTDLKLVQDVFCYGVEQQGDTVYYVDKSGLCAYHIPTATCRSLVKGVLDYAVDGDNLAYILDADEPFTTDLRYRNLSTGEDILIESGVMNAMDVCAGKLYYSRMDFEGEKVSLNIFDTESGQTVSVPNDYNGCYSLQAAPEGLYYEAAKWDEGRKWYFVSADGTAVEDLSETVPEDAYVLRIAKDGILYVAQDFYTGEKGTLRFRGSDGSDTVLFEADESAYIYMTPLGQDRWILEHQIDEGIGEPNEYGYYENYIYHRKYYILDEGGTVTQLQLGDVIAAMFADGDFPLIDSSTARKPVTRSLYELFVKTYNYEGPEPICSTTHGAWLNIADRKADLALLAAPTEEESAYLKQQGVEVEMKLYGGDGLVFIGNAANPVTDLTHEQIIGIYRGQITNWSQVGGPDRAITVYYRDEQSGSQRLFEKLVFKGLEIPDFESMGFLYMDDMSTIVDIVLEDPYSIGYSIMTYLDEVYAREELQVFGVNGVKPSPDTVKDGTYRYNTQGYVVIRSDEPVDSPARRLFNWFGCPVSDDLLTFNDVTPLSGGVG